MLHDRLNNELGPGASWALAALLIAILVATNCHYYAADHRPPTFDDAWYLETSLQFYHELTQKGFGPFWSAYTASFDIKAPLISVLPLPFYLVLGPSYRSAMLVNVLFLGISSLYLYLLASLLFSRRVALVSVLFFQTMPLAYGLSRVFMVDYGLCALLIVFLYHLARSAGFSRGADNFAAGVVLGLGLLMKILFAGFVAGPLMLTVLRRRSRSVAPQPGQSQFGRFCVQHPFVAVAGPALALAGTWYPYHWHSALNYAWQSSFGAGGELYSIPLHRWALAVINDGLTCYYAAASILAAIALVVLPRRRLEPRGTLFLVSWLLPFVGFVLGRNREIRLLLPLLPAVAVLLAAGIFEVCRGPLSRVACVAATSAFPVVVYGAMSFRSQAPSSPIQLGPWVLLTREMAWSHAPDSRGDWSQQRVLDALQTLRQGEQGDRYVIIGVEHPYLNANLLSYLNQYRQGRFHFTSFGYAESSAQAAVERFLRLDALFLLMARGFPSGALTAAFNKVNDTVQAQLDRGDLPFREQVRIPLTDQISAVIYRRVEPAQFISADEAEVRKPMMVGFSNGLNLLGYGWRKRDHYHSELVSYWQVTSPPEAPPLLHLDFRRDEHLLLHRSRLLAGGLPPSQWEPAKVLAETMLVYIPHGDDGSLDAQVWLSEDEHDAPVPIVGTPSGSHDSRVSLTLER